MAATDETIASAQTMNASGLAARYAQALLSLADDARQTDPGAVEHILFMTGDVVNEAFESFLREHRLPCLSKPFAIGEFRAAVAKMAGAAG